jgi:hypothetical protein
MTAAEILAVRDSSKAKNGPWKGAWAGEMAKKTLVKRASKSWPQSDGRHRLDDAIQILNSHEGLEEHATVDEEQIEHFMNLVAAGDGLGLIAYMRKIGDDAATACYNAAPKGQKVKLKDTVSALTREAHNRLDDYALQIREMCQADDPAVIELVDELEANPVEWELVAVRLTDIEHRQIENIRRSAA